MLLLLLLLLVVFCSFCSFLIFLLVSFLLLGRFIALLLSCVPFWRSERLSFGPTVFVECLLLTRLNSFSHVVVVFENCFFLVHVFYPLFRSFVLVPVPTWISSASSSPHVLNLAVCEIVVMILRVVLSIVFL